MDFAVDVIFVEEPLGATASQSTQNGPRGAANANEREHATVAELLPVERRTTRHIRQALITRQMILPTHRARGLAAAAPKKKPRAVVEPDQPPEAFAVVPCKGG